MPEAAEPVALTDQERADLIEALAVPHEREYRLRRLLGEIALAHGLRPAEVTIGWEADGAPVVRRWRSRS